MGWKVFAELLGLAGGLSLVLPAMALIRHLRAIELIGAAIDQLVAARLSPARLTL